MLAESGKRRYQRWTERENAIIRRHYPTRGAAALAPLLPRRNFETIKAQAIKLGVRFLGRRAWSVDDEERLRSYWERDHSLAWIAKKLGRHPRHVYRHAEKLGLLGVPQGYESLTASARRVGYSTAASLRSVLRWAGVRIHMTRSFPRSTIKGLFRTHYVDPFDVDEAVSRYLQQETLAFAASSRGIPHMTLHQWLVKEGVITPSPKRLAHRIEPATVDGVIAKYRPQVAPEEEGQAAA